MKNNSLLCAIVAGCAVLLGAAGCSKEYLDAEVIDDTLLQEVVSTNNGFNSVIIEMLPMLQNGYVPEQLDCNPEDIPEFVKPYMLDFSDYDAFTKWDVRTELVRLTADSSLGQEQKLTVARCLGGQLYYRNLFQDALSAATSMNRSTKAGSESLTAKDLMTDSFFSGLYVTNNLRRKTCLYTKSIINIPVDNDTGDRDSLAYEGGAAADTTDRYIIEQLYSECRTSCWLNFGAGALLTIGGAAAIYYLPEILAAAAASAGTGSAAVNAIIAKLGTSFTTVLGTEITLSNLTALVQAILGLADKALNIISCLDGCESDYTYRLSQL